MGFRLELDALAFENEWIIYPFLVKPTEEETRTTLLGEGILGTNEEEPNMKRIYSLALKHAHQDTTLLLLVQLLHQSKSNRTSPVGTDSFQIFEALRFESTFFPEGSTTERIVPQPMVLLESLLRIHVLDDKPYIEWLDDLTLKLRPDLVRRGPLKHEARRTPDFISPALACLLLSLAVHEDKISKFQQDASNRIQALDTNDPDRMEARIENLRKWNVFLETFETDWASHLTAILSHWRNQHIQKVPPEPLNALKTMVDDGINILTTKHAKLIVQSEPFRQSLLDIAVNASTRHLEDPPGLLLWLFKRRTSSSTTAKNGTSPWAFSPDAWRSWFGRPATTHAASSP